jgi:hypothetical protein
MKLSSYLADAVHDQHGDDGAPAGELQRGDQQREQQAGGVTEVGDEDQQARKHADRECGRYVGQPQRHAVVGGEQGHDQDLAAQVLREHGIDVRRDGVDLFVPGTRHHVRDAADHAVPVEQQVEQHHRRQHQVDRQADQRHAADLERAVDALQDDLHRIPVAGGKLLQRGRIEAQPEAEVLSQPGRQFLVGQGHGLGCACSQHRRFLVEQRQDDQDQAGGQCGQCQHDDDHGCHARQAPGGDAVGDRIADVGEDAGQQEGRQDRRQRVEQGEDRQAGGDPQGGLQAVAELVVGRRGHFK